MLKLTVANADDARNCPIRNVLDRIGDKWSLLILLLLQDTPCRFNQIRRTLGDISQRVLTQRLRDLAREGYLTRHVYPESPPRVEYALTELGRSLLGALGPLVDWSAQAHGRIKQCRSAYDLRGRG